jgi:alkanesulfonate monooxygenase SsuD/methylene tetrahydromethanopterin reductase-like flavin-dependent oxidoreductase (luciferase family)
MLECLTTLAVATTATRHAVVGSCVLQLPLRRASAVAKAAASLQVLSGGRFVLGIGVGSHPGEYAAAGVDFASRGRLVDEGLAELHRSWDSATDRGSAYRQEPQPSPIPVWIGGSSRAALRRAATAADGWVPLFMSPAEYEVALGHLGEASVAAGRAADEVLRAVVVMVSVGPEPAQATDAGTRWLSSLYGIPPKAFERHLVAGPAESCAEQLQRYFAAGAEHVAVMVTSDQPVEAFAELRGSLGAGAAERAAPAGYRPELVEVAT